MKTLFTAIFFLTVVFCASEAAGQTVNISDRIAPVPIESFVEEKMAEAGIVGMGAAIIVNRKVVWTKGFGYADKERQKPFTTDTIMNIGSIAKNFTGVCLMRAVEDGKVSLDEDIDKYLPFKVVNPHFPNEKITIRHLATHTSGLADRYPFYETTYKYGGDSVEQLGDFLRNYFEPNGKYYTQENFLDHRPGTHYQYANIPSALAGYIVEIATGRKLPEYAKQRIFKPLKMKNTGWSISEVDLEHHTKLYDKTGDELKEVPLYSFPTYPEGGVRTSVSELSRYFIALLNDGAYNGRRILSSKSVREMQRLHFTASSKPENVDIAEVNSGIFWATKQDVTFVGHAGSDPGIKAEMLSDLNREVAVILFSNTGLKTRDLIKYHFGIFNELHRYGVKLKDAKTSKGTNGRRR